MAAIFKIHTEAFPELPRELDCSAELKNFISSTCTRDPKNRPTATHLLQHPWILQDSNYFPFFHSPSPKNLIRLQTTKDLRSLLENHNNQLDQSKLHGELPRSDSFIFIDNLNFYSTSPERRSPNGSPSPSPSPSLLNSGKWIPPILHKPSSSSAPSSPRNSSSSQHHHHHHHHHHPVSNVIHSHHLENFDFLFRHFLSLEADLIYSLPFSIFCNSLLFSLLLPSLFISSLPSPLLLSFISSFPSFSLFLAFLPSFLLSAFPSPPFSIFCNSLFYFLSSFPSPPFLHFLLPLPSFPSLPPSLLSPFFLPSFYLSSFLLSLPPLFHLL